MQVYLIRHTRPDVPEGTCYGRTDVPLDEAAFEAGVAALQSARASVSDLALSQRRLSDDLLDHSAGQTLIRGIHRERLLTRHRNPLGGQSSNVPVHQVSNLSRHTLASPSEDSLH